MAFQCDYELLHYLVSLPFEVFTPSAISAAIEAWTWVIAEKPSMEIGIMSEILSAWSSTISNEKGIFSLSLKYVYCSSLISAIDIVILVTMTHSSIRLVTALQTRRSSIEVLAMPAAYSIHMSSFCKCF